MPRGEREEALVEALLRIDEETRWFADAKGSISRQDITDIIRETRKQIDQVRDLIYAEGEEC